MDHKKLGAIGRLTDMVKTQKQAHLAGLMRHDQVLRDQIRALDHAIVERAQDPHLDTARQAGADLLWLRWIDRRKAAINLERAQLAGDIITARDDLARAFGRAQVSQILAARALALRRKTRP